MQQDPLWLLPPYDRQRELANQLTYCCMELEKTIRSIQSEFEQTKLELAEKKYLCCDLQQQLQQFYQDELENRTIEYQELLLRLQKLGYPYQP